MERNDIIRVLLTLSRHIKTLDGEEGARTEVCRALDGAVDLLMQIPPEASKDDERLLERLAAMRDKSKAASEIGPDELAMLDVLAPGLKGLKKKMLRSNRESYELLSAAYKRLAELTGKTLHA